MIDITDKVLEFLIGLEESKGSVELSSEIEPLVKELIGAGYICFLPTVDSHIELDGLTGSIEIGCVYNLEITDKGQGYIEGYMAGLTVGIEKMEAILTLLLRSRIKV